jgi:hypothetical protein
MKENRALTKRTTDAAGKGNTLTFAKKLLLTGVRGRVAAFLVLAIIAATVTAISIASAESKKPVEKEGNASAAALKTQADPDRSREKAERLAAVQEQGSLGPVQGWQMRPVPVLTMANAPDMPQCRDILNQDILDNVNTSVEDPARYSRRTAAPTRT